MLPIDAQTLREIAPRFSGHYATDQLRITNALGPFLVPVMNHYAINTPLRIAHFLGQCCEESAGFRTLEEFASGEAYEGRRDLGNIRPGDGKLFKGRGLIDLTGGANYKEIGAAIGVDLYNHPERAAEPDIAVKTACEFWIDHGLNTYADRDDLLTITQRVNGGINGIADRRTFTANAKAALARMQALLIHGKQTTMGETRAVLHRGTTGAQVSTLQRMLSGLGHKITIDGDYGAATEYVVRQFQDMEQLTPDGIVGAVTWQALDDAFAKVHVGPGT